MYSYFQHIVGALPQNSPKCQKFNITHNQKKYTRFFFLPKSASYATAVTPSSTFHLAQLLRGRGWHLAHGVNRVVGKLDISHSILNKLRHDCNGIARVFTPSTTSLAAGRQARQRRAQTESQERKQIRIAPKHEKIYTKLKINIRGKQKQYPPGNGARRWLHISIPSTQLCRITQQILFSNGIHRRDMPLPSHLLIPR